MSVQPVVRNFIACKQEPTVVGPDPSVHGILYALQPKAPFQYPIWLRSFYLFAMITSGRGKCTFFVEVRLVELDHRVTETETVVGRSKPEEADLGIHPLPVRFLSIQMPPIQLPKRGVYRLYLICDDAEIATEVIHAR
jgi:hypothetical protein